MPYGASPDDWYNLGLLGIGADLLPVVSNIHAPISPNSKLKSLGKVPSRYNANHQIAGIPNWTQHQTTPQDIARWSKEPDYGICIQTRLVRALDVDVEDQAKANLLLKYLGKYFPTRVYTRCRANSSKFLIPFILKGEYPKRVIKVDGGVVEFLATGQHFVAIGTHPSGVRYGGLENVSSFPELTPEQFETLWQSLVECFAIEPPSESTLRNPLSGAPIVAALNDPIAQYLAEQGLVTGLGKEGQHYLKCPFASEHTEPEEKDGTSTAYLPAGNREYECGHFKCLHAHCANRPDEAFLDALNYRSKDFDVIEDTPEEKKEALKAKERFDVIPIGEFTKRPETSWLIKKILPEKSFFEVYGSSGDGKTFVCLDMMLSLCRGVDWNGHKTVKKCKVVYICAEGAGGFISRLKAYAHHHSLDINSLDFGIIPETPDFRKVTDIKALAAKVNAFGKVDVVIVDTLAQVTAGADENAGKDMGPALKNCQELMKLTGAACGIVHHAGKDVSRGSRGWSGIKAPLDAEYSVLKDATGKRTFWVEKLKDARDGFGFDFELTSVIFGEDSEGEALDSCVVNFLEAPATKTKAKPKIDRKMGTKQQVAYNIFTELGGGGEVLHARLVDAMLAKLPTTGATSRAKMKYNIERTIESLIDNGELAYEPSTKMLTAPLGV